MPCNSLTCQIGDKGPKLPPVSSSRLRDGRRPPISTSKAPRLVPSQDTLPAAEPAGMVLAEPVYRASGGGTGEGVTDVDCWTDPSNAACAGDPANIAGKQSSQRDLDVVGTIGGIGRTAADLLGAYSSYQMRERTADREDRRVELERERVRLENEPRVALAEISARGGPEAARVAADLQAQLARIQGQQGSTNTALMVGGIVVGVALVGALAWRALTPRSNPGRRVYRGRRK